MYEIYGADDSVLMRRGGRGSVVLLGFKLSAIAIELCSQVGACENNGSLLRHFFFARFTRSEECRSRKGLRR